MARCHGIFMLLVDEVRGRFHLGKVNDIGRIEKADQLMNHFISPINMPIGILHRFQRPIRPIAQIKLLVNGLCNQPGAVHGQVNAAGEDGVYEGSGIADHGKIFAEFCFAVIGIIAFHDQGL